MATRTIYYMTKSSGRAGCANISWKWTNRFASKAELKKAYKGRCTIAWAKYEEEITAEQKAICIERGYRNNLL